MNDKRNWGGKLRILAYIFLVVIAGYSASRANTAVNLARAVDHRGDIRACNQENLIRSESNNRDRLLEETAKLTNDSLIVIRQAPRPKDDPTNKRLRLIARRAAKIQTNFKPAKVVDCNKVFPGP